MPHLLRLTSVDWSVSLRYERAGITTEYTTLRDVDAMNAPTPMFAELAKRPFSAENWIFERKFDGVRALVVRKSGGEPELWSRNDLDMSGGYPEIVEALAQQGGPDFVVDGEIVAFDGPRTSFARLQQRMHLRDPELARQSGVPVFFYVFDLLSYGGVDATSLTVVQRKELLREAFDFEDPLRFSDHRATEGERFFQQACAEGWEGLIAKRADSAYRSGRSADWLKFKCVFEQEFVVGGFTDPSGTRTGFGALLVGYYEGDSLRYAGKIGTGFNERTLRDLRTRLESLEQSRSPFFGKVGERGAHWTKPEMVVQAGFAEWTGDGKMRHPRFIGVRTDKNPTEVVRE